VARKREPAPFGHVLCPIDFSDSSHHALALAADLAGPRGRGITLLHVIEMPVTFSGEPPVTGYHENLVGRARKVLDKWAAELRAKVSVPVTTRTVVGFPGAEILATLDADPTLDLVVVGSHGRTGFRRVLLGSVAEKIARHARCPVLVARTRAS